MLVEDLIFLDIRIADVDSTSFSCCYLRFVLALDLIAASNAQ